MQAFKSSLTLYIGPMFSGKTSKLMHDLETFSSIGLNVLYVNSDIDVRSEEEYSTHNKIKILSSKIKFIKTSKLADIDVSTYDAIGVDEAGFFNDLEVIINWVDKLCKIVLVSGLDGNYKRKPFGKTLDLIPYADKVVKFNAYCLECIKNGSLRAAPFTYRKDENDKEILVGGNDKYLSLCRFHYLKFSKS